ncbi:MAG TPA: DUF4129 domain-containing protein [Myxococcaceae bacterium]
MAIAATELRPRSAVALFDAAVRLAARSTGLWALTLPGGAAVTAAAIHYLDTYRGGDDTWGPALWLTGAWFFRGLCQGAASHWAQQLLVGPGEASAARSFLAALKRLPSLIIATVVLGAVAWLSATLTLGVGVFFFSAHLAGYAAVMQGKGHPVAIWATANKLLGPARRTANMVRICLWSQWVLAINLHLGTLLGLELAETLLGLEVSFANRYASTDNPAWILTVLALTFALVEPVRAALGTLLLLDGRVRQEGLDLLSAVEQLPSRARPARPAAAVALVLLCALGAPDARAQDDGDDEAPRPATANQLTTHTLQLAKDCEVQADEVRPQLRALSRLDGGQRLAYQRFLDRLGWYVDDGECDDARTLLFHALDQVNLAAEQKTGQGPESASVRARAILDRPEFQQPPPRKAKPKEEPGPTEETAWNRFWRRMGEWLREFLRPRRDVQPREVDLSPGGGEVMANGLAVVLVAAVLAVLAWLVLRRPRRAGNADPEPDVVSSPLAPPGVQESALSRPPEGWAALADELASKGQYREAVRGLYLAALSRLHREGALDYDPSLSNWDHVRRYKGPPPWKPPFRELTLRFDFVFYGNVGGTAEGYRDFRALSRPLLDPTTPTA